MKGAFDDHAHRIPLARNDCVQSTSRHCSYPTMNLLYQESVRNCNILFSVHRYQPMFCETGGSLCGKVIFLTHQPAPLQTRIPLSRPFPTSASRRPAMTMTGGRELVCERRPIIVVGHFSECQSFPAKYERLRKSCPIEFLDIQISAPLTPMRQPCFALCVSFHHFFCDQSKPNY